MNKRSSRRVNLPAVITATNLWKTYNGKDVVRGINCHVEAGEILGFLGPNGAGKTTSVGMMYGGVLPTRGTIRFGEWSLPQHGRQARAFMGIVTQDDNLDPDFTVFHNLTVFANHYGFTREQARHRADELIERLELTQHRNHKPDELSGGLKRRLVLARALINHPRLVFLDEPTTGLDPDSRQSFWKLVAELRAENCGVILTTHYMDEAQRLSDRLILMQQGEIVDEGTPDALIQRVIGPEVVESEGIPESVLRDLAATTGAWLRPFGRGWLMSVTAQHRQHVLDRLDAEPSTLLSIRAANLEDVFLRLTGDKLQ